MDEFILIFRHEDGLKVASPEQIQIWMKQTKDWMGGIAAQNKLSGGNGLPFADARVVRPHNIVTNGISRGVFYLNGIERKQHFKISSGSKYCVVAYLQDRLE